MSLFQVKKGSLKREDDFKIKKNYAYLMDNFEPSDGTMDHMISSLVFNTDDVDQVKNGGEKTRRGRVERFLNILLRSGTDDKIRSEDQELFALASSEKQQQKNYNNNNNNYNNVHLSCAHQCPECSHNTY